MPLAVGCPRQVSLKGLCFPWRWSVSGRNALLFSRASSEGGRRAECGSLHDPMRSVEENGCVGVVVALKYSKKKISDFKCKLSFHVLQASQRHKTLSDPFLH